MLSSTQHEEAKGQIVAREVLLYCFKGSSPYCMYYRGRSSLRAAAALFAASALQGAPDRRSLLWMEISPFKPKQKPSRASWDSRSASITAEKPSFSLHLSSVGEFPGLTAWGEQGWEADSRREGCTECFVLVKPHPLSGTCGFIGNLMCGSENGSAVTPAVQKVK